MNRFVHSVQKVVFLDGDDIRRAPMTAALFRCFANEDPALRLWRVEVDSAGSGKFTTEGTPPEPRAQRAMRSLGLDISFHKARSLALSDIEDASIVLAMERKHVEYVHANQCSGYPAYCSKIIPFLDYIAATDRAYRRAS